MITLKHLKIYQNYGGDGDMFVRLGTKEEKEILNYENWKLIEGFLQDIVLVKEGLASKEFSESLYKRLKENCDSEETINHLKIMADKQWNYF